MCVELPCGYSSQTLTKIIAYCGIITYACFLTATALLGLIIECQRDFKNQYSQENVIELSFNESDTEDISSVTTTEIPHVENNNVEYNDLARFLEVQMSDIRTIFFVIWILINFIFGLIISIVLLHGAQERNLFKVRAWFYATITIYLLWIPIYTYWVCHSEDPVNALMSGFMTYMLGGLCLWVVSSFIEELRIESISHRVGYKDVLLPFYKI